MSRQPENRFQSVDEFLFAIEATRSGRCAVQCPSTAAKRGLQAVSHKIDTNPVTTVLTMIAVALIFVTSIVWTVVATVLLVGASPPAQAAAPGVPAPVELPAAPAEAAPVEAAPAEAAP